jgi:hypothetical protein
MAVSDLGKNLSAGKSAYRMIKKAEMAPRLEWRHLSGKAEPPTDKNEAGAFSEPARRGCSRTVAEVRLVGVDSAFSAIHTESNWQGAFEHTNPQAAIMAVLALVRRLTEHTQGSHESNVKIAAALNSLVAAFSDRKPIASSLDSTAKDGEATKEDGDVISDRNHGKAANAAHSLGAPGETKVSGTVARSRLAPCTVGWRRMADRSQRSSRGQSAKLFGIWWR